MGCDIHLFTEQKQTVNSVQVWVNTDNWRLNHYYEKDNDDGEREWEINSVNRDRNYAAFAALANVRDYSDKSPSIGKPKGLPKNCSAIVKKESDYWGCDGHSHSYATLKEIKGFIDKNQGHTFSGFISEKQAKDLDENGIFPDSWCQGTNMSGFVHREWHEPKFSPLQQIYKDLLSHFKKLMWGRDIEDDDLKNYRMVFWFDN